MACVLKTRFAVCTFTHVHVVSEMVVHELSVIVCSLSCVCIVRSEQSLDTRVLQLLLADSVLVSCVSY